MADGVNLSRQHNTTQKDGAHSQGRALFTLFEARSINFAIVVYAMIRTSMLDLHNLGTGGKHGQESKEGEEGKESRQEEKEVISEYFSLEQIKSRARL